MQSIRKGTFLTSANRHSKLPAGNELQQFGPATSFAPPLIITLFSMGKIEPNM